MPIENEQQSAAGHRSGRRRKETAQLDEKFGLTESLKQQGGAAFKEWLQHIEVKTLMSILPPATNYMQRDCLMGLLESAFRSGASFGAGAATVELVQLLTKPKQDHPNSSAGGGATSLMTVGAAMREATPRCHG